MYYRFSDEEALQKIGSVIRSSRLKQNRTQSELAEQAAISLNALKRLESGRGATLKTFIRIINLLGLQEWLYSIEPQKVASPILKWYTGKAERQRATRKRASRRIHP